MTSVRDAFERYSEPLMRSVGDTLVKPRNKLPLEELIDRCLATLENAAVVDRRIRDLPDGARAALIAVSRSGQPLWTAGQLITLAATVGHADGIQTVYTLLSNGLIIPESTALPIPDFDAWFAAAGGLRAVCVVPPSVRTRASAIAYEWPVLDHEAWAGPSHPVDKLEIPLRLAALRQRVEAEPVRLTKTGTLYKKDQSRFETDACLTMPGVADAGLLMMFWSLAAGLLRKDAETLYAHEFSDVWQKPIDELIRELLSASFAIESWRPLTGAISDPQTDLTIAASAELILLMLLAAVPAETGVRLEVLASWLWEHHPSWSSIVPSEHARSHGAAWVDAYVRSVLAPLGVAETANGMARLTSLGRGLLDQQIPATKTDAMIHALLVQPNSEILAYRQGLTVSLIRSLSRFAWWKMIGPACTLELTAEQVYRGLESGLSVAEVLQTLQKHSPRPVPTAVEDAIRRWGSKRERVTVFTSATLVEFATKADLDEAISRGIVSIRLTERVGLTADGSDPDYTALRLTGNRDYEARQQPCLSVSDDGLEWTIDYTFADLLLDVELNRVAKPVTDDAGAVRFFKADAAKIQTIAARPNGVAELEQWFLNRTGQAMPAVIQLFTHGPTLAGPTVRNEQVIRLSTEAMCDGVMQWPDSARLIRERLGPVTVVVDGENVEDLRNVLKSIGVELT